MKQSKLSQGHKLLNAHCHLDKIFDMEAFLDGNSDTFICNAVCEAELQRYLLIQKTNFLLTTGQHPLYPPNTITIERLIELLENKKLYAIGEIGLDKRNQDFQWQKNTFMQQTDIANQYQKPVIIHCVGYYYEIYNIIKKNFSKTEFTLHAFQGSEEIVKEFSKYNVTFSLHKNIVNIKNAKNIIKKILTECKYCFETDVCEDNLHDVKKTEYIISNFI